MNGKIKYSPAVAAVAALVVGSASPREAPAKTCHPKRRGQAGRTRNGAPEVLCGRLELHRDLRKNFVLPNLRKKHRRVFQQARPGRELAAELFPLARPRGRLRRPDRNDV